MATHIWKCKNCELEIKIEGELKPVYHDCPGVPPDFFQRVRHYFTAVRKWARAGYPMRDNMEVNRILMEHCHSCALNEDGMCVHPSCGCRINKRSFALLNKIKMATESCPLNRW